MYAGSALTVVATILLITMRLRGRHAVAAAAKIAASCGFLWTAHAAGAVSAGPYGRWIFLGLVLGWFGDAFLLARQSRRMFLAGLVSFLLGHVAYIVALMIHGIGVPIAGLALIALLGLGAAFYRWLGPAVHGAMRYGVGAYIVVISVMLACGIATYGFEAAAWLIPASALFYLSDLGVALDRFKPLRVPAYAWSLPLYYTGQLLFAWSVRAVF